MIHELVNVGNNNIIQITNKTQDMSRRQNTRALLQREWIKSTGIKCQFEFEAHFSILNSNNTQPQHSVFKTTEELNQQLSGTVSRKTEYDKLHKGSVYCKAHILDYMKLVLWFLVFQYSFKATYCKNKVLLWVVN